MKFVNNLRLIILSIVLALGLFGFGFVFLHQSVTGITQNSNLLFFGFEVSSYFFFDLSIFLIVVAGIILILVILSLIMEKSIVIKALDEKIAKNPIDALYLLINIYLQYDSESFYNIINLINDLHKNELK